MSQHEERIREALAELRSLAKRERTPDRFLARALLIELGRMELAEPGSAAALAAEVREAAAPIQAGWESAVESELSMACTEHVRSVDPRYLDQPIYDFQYTIAARERLEARLVAAGLLELEAPEHLLDQVAEADSLLAPYLEQRGEA